MALTSKQRNKLPNSAFAMPSKRAYPVPTKAQAKAAGISEAQRVRMMRNALARAAQPQTRGSYPTVAKVVRARANEKIATVSRAKGTTSSPGKRTGHRRRR
jgi:GrpB-like predicted nucleotidyltransferase (UPF0157 family)